MAFALKPRTVSEADVLDLCIRALERMPAVAMVIRINSGAARVGVKRIIRFYWLYWCGFVHYQGLYDLMVLLKGGRIVLLEIKAKDGKAPDARLRESQQRVRERLLECRIPAYAVDNYDDAIAVVRKASIEST